MRFSVGCGGFGVRTARVRCVVAGALFLIGAGFSQVGAEPLEVFRDCDVCPEMVELPLGEFVMGAPDDEFRSIIFYDEKGMQTATAENPHIPANEGPQRRVTVDIRIAMGKNEVTFDEWMACVNDGGCGGHIPDGTADQWGSDEAILRSLTDPQFKPVSTQGDILKVLNNPEFLRIGGRYPVNDVSYLDALAYVDWLNRKLGTEAYRLPTEAEWEYAARAGTTTRFAQGYEAGPEQANISGSNTAAMEQVERPDLRTLGHPVPVDELDAANLWGLRHMSGNLSEITQSCYWADLTGLPDLGTTSAWLEKDFGASCDRALRGGSYGHSMGEARVAARRDFPETWRIDIIGFRIVKVLD